ncbi:MAG: hypothetical protein AB4058_00225 [Microcystaceae cyanobacterium]
MTHKNYVIKSYQFGYNDEYFYVCGSNIHSTFTNLEEAQNTYRQLEVKAARLIDYLDEYENIFEGTAQFRQQLTDFIFEKTGERFDLYDRVSLPSSLSDEDVFTFVEMADIHAYQLLVFEDEPKFYALWLPQDNKYYLDEDECYAALVYYPAQDELLKRLESLTYDWQDKKIEGELSEISETPSLLEQLIKTNKSINYNATKKTLTIRGDKVTPYVEVNALLKQPFYEVRELNLQQVLEIEKEITDQYNSSEFFPD